METIFQISGLLVMPFWLLIIAAPLWSVTRRLMQSPFVCALPALLYAVLVVPRLAGLWPALAHPTLKTIAALLGTPEGATLAWAHFLAFDLFVGRWIYLDSREHNRNALLVAPILFLTFMFGPLGFMTYLAFRGVDDTVRKPHSQPLALQGE